MNIQYVEFLKNIIPILFLTIALSVLKIKLEGKKMSFNSFAKQRFFAKLRKIKAEQAAKEIEQEPKETEQAEKETEQAAEETAEPETTQKNITKTTQSRIQKGKEYEYFVGAYFKKQGYKIFYNGINKGKRDGGIDILCHKDKETILIQCKNWKSPVSQDEIRKFIGDCYVYINKNEKFLKDRTIKKLFVAACSETKYAVERYVKANKNEIEYLNLAMNENSETKNADL